MKRLDSFDLKDYATWLDRVKDRRAVIPASAVATHPYLRLQHDVDISPQWATMVGSIENAIGVRSTFCFLVGADFYEVTSAATMRCLKVLQEYGHDVGLHFDWRRYEEAGIPLVEGLRRDKVVLGECAEAEITLVCAHKPLRNGDPEVSEAELDLLGLRTLQVEGELYVSDSAGGLSDDGLAVLMAAAGEKPTDDHTLTGVPRLRFNMHPAWWGGLPRFHAVQARINELVHGLRVRSTREWAGLDDHPNAQAQNARDRHSGNPQRRNRADSAKPNAERRVVLPSDADVAAAKGNGGRPSAVER